MIVDLTDVMTGQGPARLLDVVPGRSAAACIAGSKPATKASGTRVEIVVMDGFGGYKNAAVTALPDAVTVMISAPLRQPRTLKPEARSVLAIRNAI